MYRKKNNQEETRNYSKGEKRQLKPPLSLSLPKENIINY